IRGARELPLRDQRSRSADAARRDQMAVLDAQVDRGDRDDDPAGNQARPANVLTTKAATPSVLRYSGCTNGGRPKPLRAYTRVDTCCWRHCSNRQIAAAAATLSDSMPPGCGIV